jgi:wobble nucleotide-excising tRNase
VDGVKRRFGNQISRVVWEEKNGKIDAGLSVLHRCDDRRCINPDHLFLGTLDDNMADMVKKNRQAKGESNGQVKLERARVREIRMMAGSNRALAKKYGVSSALISLIKNGKRWGWLE